MSSAFQDALSGSVGAVASALSTYPLDVVKTRLQAQRRSTLQTGLPQRQVSEEEMLRNRAAEEIQRQVSGPLPYSGTMDCLRRIVREEGVTCLYAGLGPACLKTALTNFIFYYNIRVVAPLLRRWPLLQGMGAGLGVQVIVLPIDLIVTRLQSMRKQSTNFLQVLVRIIEREGVWRLWSGIGPGLLLTINPGITQLVLTWLGGATRTASALRAFWSAAAAKAVASFLTYPYMRAKVQMQVQGLSSSAPTSMRCILGDIIADSGVVGLFDGLAPQLGNAVLKDAILNLVRVKIALLVERAFIALFDARRRIC